MIHRVNIDTLLALSAPNKRTKPAVLKFYSNTCHLCHGFSSIYKTLSDTYKDKYDFLVFSVDDGVSNIEKKFGFSGVPTLCIFYPNGTWKIAADPKEPDDETWYTEEYIKNFLEKQ